MAVCDADGRIDRCRHFLFIVVVRPTDSLHRAIGMLPDLCTIIEYAMYTDDQSGNVFVLVFGSWPPYSTLFYEKSHLEVRTRRIPHS